MSITVLSMGQMTKAQVGQVIWPSSLANEWLSWKLSPGFSDAKSLWDNRTSPKNCPVCTFWPNCTFRQAIKDVLNSDKLMLFWVWFFKLHWIKKSFSLLPAEGARKIDILISFGNLQVRSIHKQFCWTHIKNNCLD